MTLHLIMKITARFWYCKYLLSHDISLLLLLTPSFNILPKHACPTSGFSPEQHSLYIATCVCGPKIKIWQAVISKFATRHRRQNYRFSYFTSLQVINSAFSNLFVEQSQVIIWLEIDESTMVKFCITLQVLKASI